MQKQIKKLVKNFELDGSSDYKRMEAEVTSIIGQVPDNDTVWGLVRKASKKAKKDKVTLDLSFL